MTDKLQIAREYILKRIESGEFERGGKLPAAREFCGEIGVSFAIVQLAFNSLTRDGVLFSVPRQGTYVRTDWQKRILSGSVIPFRPVWSQIFEERVKLRMPDIRVSDKFDNAIFEIRTTRIAQRNQSEYLDLKELFDEEYPDKRDFFMARFEPFFSRSGELFAIPLVFSPWVICCNTELIRRAGGAAPGDNWTWSEFIELVRVLRKTLPAKKVLNFFTGPSFWLNYIFRAGGSIIELENGKDKAMIDSARVIQGLNCIKELYEALGRPDESDGGDYEGDFSRGELALRLGSREDYDYASSLPLKCASLPLIPGGSDRVRQAGDQLCVRRVLNDFEQARVMIRILLSPETQDWLGSLRYGIPVRRTSAIRSFAENDSADRIFFSEMAKIAPDRYLAWPEVHDFTQNAFERVWKNGESAEAIAAEIASALRTIICHTH